MKINVVLWIIGGFGVAFDRYCCMGLLELGRLFEDLGSLIGRFWDRIFEEAMKEGVGFY